MNARTLASVAVLGAGLLAQAPPVKIPREPSPGTPKTVAAPLSKTGDPIDWNQQQSRSNAPSHQLGVREKKVADAVNSVLQKAPRDPNRVDFDVVDGTVWALGNGYKARFDTTGWSFIAQPRTGAPALEPIRLHLAAGTVGDKALRIADCQPTRSDRRVEYRRGDVVEAIDLRGGNVEQSFTFAALPARGDLVLDLAVDTALQAANAESGIRFTSEWDDVSYSTAVAIDADGTRATAETAFANGHVTIRVPASFVANAKLPLVVDPLVTSNVVTSNGAVTVNNPDVAWDDGSGTWAVVFSQFYGGSDWDCYVQRMDANLNPVGSTSVIDYTTDAWTKPRIADCNNYGLLCVVAQAVSTTSSGVIRIGARLMNNDGTLPGAQFSVTNAGVDSLNPAIAGDPTFIPPTYFTVVWEHSYSSTDHDIYSRQIDNSGNLRGTGPTIIQADTNFQHNPSISKSDGAAPGGDFTQQRFVIVYQQTYSSTDEDIWGSLLTWDGNFVQVGGQNVFTVDYSGNNDVTPAVSSLTLPDGSGNRYFLAAYQDTNANGGDIVATCMDFNGNFFDVFDVSVNENQSFRLGWDQQAPSVDTDGLRFCVGYHENYANSSGSTLDLDTRCSLVGLSGGFLRVEDGGVILAYTTDREFNISVASTYSGNGNYSGQRYCTVNQHNNNPTGTYFAIDAFTYDGYAPGGFSTRATGCGGLIITPGSEAPILGNTISFSLNSGPYLAGFLVGLQASTPIPPCPGCTLGVSSYSALLGSSCSINVPAAVYLVGAMVAIQGLDFEPTGPCLGSIKATDTIDITVQ